jgi:tetratricopeptide (TPR) repeat protein
MARLTKKAAAQLTAYLGELPTERLVGLVLEQAEQDVELRTRLLVEAASAGGGPLDVSSYRRSFSDALRSGSANRRDHARTSGPWARTVMGVVGQIGDLLPDHPAAVIDITEYALGRVDVTMGRVDDSSGWFSQITTELESLHHQACETVRPDPIALAQRLFALDVDSEWDILYDAPNRYADVLGDDGLAELKRLADERWDSLSDSERASAGRGHFHLVKLREHLAKAAGDVDARVELLAQDLSYPYHYVKIAEVLIEADRSDDALAWAERGLAAFDGTDHQMRGDSRLDDVALAGWAERGRTAEVDELVWRRFTEKPGLATYQRLKRWTTESGKWGEDEPRAIAVLEEQGATNATAMANRPTPINRYVARIPAPATHDDLIAVLAWEDRLEEAWSVANEHDASLSVWLQLAAASETDWPLDAARAYGRDVEAQLDRKRYEAAVDRLGHIRMLYERCGDVAGFDAYLADLRHRHRQKTKLIRLLDEADLR